MILVNKHYADSKEVNPWKLSVCQVMCTENLQQRRELIEALHKDRKLSNLPKITQVANFFNNFYTFGNVPACLQHLSLFSDIIFSLKQATLIIWGRRRSNIPSGTNSQIKKVKMIFFYFIFFNIVYLNSFCFMLPCNMGLNNISKLCLKQGYGMLTSYICLQ